VTRFSVSETESLVSAPVHFFVGQLPSELPLDPAIPSSVDFLPGGSIQVYRISVAVLRGSHVVSENPFLFDLSLVRAIVDLDSGL
jgi:hypothetical protein